MDNFKQFLNYNGKQSLHECQYMNKYDYVTVDSSMNHQNEFVGGGTFKEGLFNEIKPKNKSERRKLTLQPLEDHFFKSSSQTLHLVSKIPDV